MANHLKALLSKNRIAAFRRHFSIPDDVQLSLVGDKEVNMERVDESIVVFPFLAIVEGGVRFPLHVILRSVLRYWGLILSQPNVNFYRIIMDIIKLNCRLYLDIGIPAIRHCYVLAKSSGRQRQYFLRAKDINHHLVTMFASSNKRVDDVMVAIRDN